MMEISHEAYKYRVACISYPKYSKISGLNNIPFFTEICLITFEQEGISVEC